ncbi:uncharacterized protein LOC131854181 [Achroia grisella]|uniref:uncharacterized protein LOC131854181 n=1 Tax=Achroia grisella TaxID=688607 RepID=UPI0027D269E0|nr:uncharacterized protein LOC131854181 [Achroia grisella]
MDTPELEPLESGVPPSPGKPPISRHCSRIASRSCYKGPIRLCKLMVLLIAVPSAFIFVPLYLRYRVFSGQMYPMSMTDMRLIDSKISTTWCQRQVVKSNTTFNAFVVPGPPQLTQDLVPVTMTRELELEDDMKEYWGFYLLKGSTVTVSTCVRWPGASLIMIKGYKHLKDCAYIGDDSSEELDELMEANKLGLISNAELIEKIQVLNKIDGKANQPDAMKRHKAGVSFHDPSNVANVTSSDNIPTVDVTDHDPKELREILERLHALRQAAKTESLKYYKPPSHLMALPGLHRHRDTNVDRDERRWIYFKDIDGNNTKTNDKQIINNKLETTTEIPEDKNKNSITKPNVNENSNNEASTVTGNVNKPIVKTDTVKEYIGKNYGEIKTSTVGLTVTNAAYTTQNPHAEEINSKEVFEDVLKKLQALGDRGKRVLSRLHETLGLEYVEPAPGRPTKSDIMSVLTGSSEELDRLRNILVEAIDEEKTRSLRQQKRHDAMNEARAKRELMLGQIELQKQLNDDDEARNYAAEEDLQPDGYAEHHEQVNETTAFDMSNSEFWSSFSSSEEALLECEGLILNLPLTPHPSCNTHATDEEKMSAAQSNALTYRVPTNGYYFFVFNSENEVQTNFIRAKFDLQKTKYDVARTALRECKNSTERCDLSLDIFSSQKVVLEVPLSNNDSLWNEQFVIISECEPRTSVYLFCVIAVPILILIFAFQ